VYFGDDYDAVANATEGGLQQGVTTFSPGPLETEKTYYWRVDELGEAGAHTGEVWSFTTAKEGGGLRAEYYHWSGDFPPSDPFQVFVTSEMVPEINWNWGDPGSPHDLVTSVADSPVRWRPHLLRPTRSMRRQTTVSVCGLTVRKLLICGYNRE
jgi:hypothetical protein